MLRKQERRKLPTAGKSTRGPKAQESCSSRIECAGVKCQGQSATDERGVSKPVSFFIALVERGTREVAPVMRMMRYYSVRAAEVRY